MPNQAVLIQSIGLQEAKLSSEIENIVTTNDELYRAFANRGKKTDLHTKEVLRYNDALWYGFDAIGSSGDTSLNRVSKFIDPRLTCQPCPG